MRHAARAAWATLVLHVAFACTIDDLPDDVSVGDGGATGGAAGIGSTAGATGGTTGGGGSSGGSGGSGGDSGAGGGGLAGAGVGGVAGDSGPDVTPDVSPDVSPDAGACPVTPCTPEKPVCRAGVCRAVKRVATGTSLDHTCVGLDDGSVRCWGSNASGQLGIAGISESLKPTEVPSLSDVEELVSGSLHTCALRSNGQVLCWGRNAEGQTGQPASSVVPTPSPVALGGVPAADVDATADSTCASLTNGELWCWGDNKYGQLGLGTSGVGTSTPQKVGGLPLNPTFLRAGAFYWVAGFANGDVYAWGGLSCGGMAGQPFSQSVLTPTKITGMTGVTDFGLGDLHGCAIKAGVLSCWGCSGLVGDGTSSPSSTAKPVASGISGVDAGWRHTCAFSQTGTVSCWGGNQSYVLGNTGLAATSPVPVTWLSNVTALWTLWRHSCAVANGVFQCWGEGISGQLGNGFKVDSATGVIPSW